MDNLALFRRLQNQILKTEKVSEGQEQSTTMIDRMVNIKYEIYFWFLMLKFQITSKQPFVPCRELASAVLPLKSKLYCR